MKSKLLIYLALVLSSSLPLKAAEHLVATELNPNEFSESYSNYRVITNENLTLSPETFAMQTQMGWITASEYKRLKLTGEKACISTPHGSNAFCLTSLTDPSSTPCEEMKAHVVVFQDGRPKYQFDFKNFKNFDADWIDEKTLKIVSWRGTRVQITELVNVKTGKVIYRSADGIYDRLEPASEKRK